MLPQVRRVYEASSRTDGLRVLVDRLWPRGITKAAAQIDHWTKATAPSTELRRWYGHDPAKWQEFKRRYFKELDSNQKAVAERRQHMRRGPVTFLYSSKERKLNNTWAQSEYLPHK